jgi:hypothetical protein
MKGDRTEPKSARTLTGLRALVFLWNGLSIGSVFRKEYL